MRELQEGEAFPTMGSTVHFRDGDTTSAGIVNGKPVGISNADGELVEVYLPVHVHDGNRNIAVHGNILVEAESAPKATAENGKP